MQIYVLRHGIAEDRKPGSSDAARALTKEGREKLESVLKRAAESGVNPTLILTSPYVRAVQTAELAAKILKHAAPPVHTESLVPDGSPRGVWNEIREHRDRDQILLAGHEPLLSQVVSYFLAAPALRVEMKKAALVCIDFESVGVEPHGTLKWMLTPRFTT